MTTAELNRNDMNATINISPRASRVEWAEMRGELKTGLAELRVEMHKGFANNIRWTVGTIIAIGALGVAILGVILDKPMPATVAQVAAPAIIYLFPAPPAKSFAPTAFAPEK